MIDSGLLAQAKKGDKTASEKLTQANLGLIWSVARRFYGRGVEPDDLFQLGCLGFIKALDGFDEAYGTQFSTYAVPKIAGEIRRFLRDDGAVKVSRGLKERAMQLSAGRVLAEQRLGRAPTVSELQEMTGLSPEEIAEAELALLPAESLQRESGEEGLTLEHLLGECLQEDRVLENVTLHQAIDELPEKERQVIALRYFHGLTQSVCARIMKVSQVQISRLERKAIAALREILL